MTTGLRTENAGYWGHLKTRDERSTGRLFLRAFLPFVGVLLLAVGALFNWRVAALDRDLDTTIGAFLELAGNAFTRDLQHPIEDLRFLSRELRGFDASTVARNTEQLHNLSAARDRYVSIRILDTRGIERVRIDRARQHGAAPHATLSDWSHGNAFSTLTSLQEHGMFVSSFELRTERGKVVEPFEPVVRFGTPLTATDGTRAGYILIDLDATATLAALKVANPNGFVELLTDDGYWIKARDRHLEWGAVLREREHLLFSIRNARAWGHMTANKSGKIRTENGGFWYRSIVPEDASVSPPRWLLALHVPQDRLRARSVGVATGLIVIALAAALMAAPFCWWLARKAQPSHGAQG